MNTRRGVPVVTTHQSAARNLRLYASRVVAEIETLEADNEELLKTLRELLETSPKPEVPADVKVYDLPKPTRLYVYARHAARMLIREYDES